jgi:hypothetical protein
MTYLETPIGMIVTLDIAADGSYRAGNVERRSTVTVDGQPRPDVLTRDVITADMLPKLLPQAALMAQVDALTAERDAALARAILP